MITIITKMYRVWMQKKVVNKRRKLKKHIKNAIYGDGKPPGGIF
jgi:hypothetical protein